MLTKRWSRWVLLWIVAFALPVWFVLMLLFPDRGVGPHPFPIPTTASAPKADEPVFAWLHPDGACLYLFPRNGGSQGPSIMPVWPIGFHASIGARGSFALYSEPNQAIAAAAPSELMELHGQYVKSPPTDAVIPPECTHYPIFLVGRLINLS